MIEPEPVSPSVKTRPMSVRVGFVLFVTGLVFLVVIVVPFFFGDHDRSLWLNLGAMLAPLGFVVAIVGSFRAGRAQQRAALKSLEVGNDAS